MQSAPIVPTDITTPCQVRVLFHAIIIIIIIIPLLIRSYEALQSLKQGRLVAFRRLLKPSLHWQQCPNLDFFTQVPFPQKDQKHAVIKKAEENSKSSCGSVIDEEEDGKIKLRRG